MISDSGPKTETRGTKPDNYHQQQHYHHLVSENEAFRKVYLPHASSFKIVESQGFKIPASKSLCSQG